MNNGIDTIINEMYDVGYFAKYGMDVFIACFSLITTFILVYYFHILKSRNELNDDWQNERCKPWNLPFAGVIHPPQDGSSKLEFTGKNFSFCMNHFVKYVCQIMLAPIMYSLRMVTSIFAQTGTAINAIRLYLGSVRKNIYEIYSSIIQKLYAYILEVYKIIIKARDGFSKFIGVMTASMFSLMATGLTIKAAVGSIAEILVKVIVLLVASAVGFALIPFAWPVAFVVMALAIAVSGVLLSMKIQLPRVIKLHGIRIPGIPTLPSARVIKKPSWLCFHGDTRVQMHDDSWKKFKDIQLGDILIGNHMVTTCFKVIANDDFYSLGDIIVSGHHKMYHVNHVIYVKDHPDSHFYKSRASMGTVYCINTATKIIPIGPYYFKDYDEMEPEECNKLNMVINSTMQKEMQYSVDFRLPGMIHTYLDGGVSNETWITMKDKTNKMIKDIQPNDVLYDDNRVLGKVYVDMNYIDQIYEYDENGDKFIGSMNLWFCRGREYIHGRHMMRKLVPVSEKGKHVIEHLITSKGYFYLSNGAPICDYNSLIDAHLK